MNSEMRLLEQQAKMMDAVIDILMTPRSPRARGAQSSAPSLPAAGVGYVDSRHEFDRDSQATGV